MLLYRVVQLQHALPVCLLLSDHAFLLSDIRASVEVGSLSSSYTGKAIGSAMKYRQSLGFAIQPRDAVGVLGF